MVKLFKWVLSVLFTVFMLHLMLGEFSPLNLYLKYRDLKSQVQVNSAKIIPLDSLNWVSVGSLKLLLPSDLELVNEGENGGVNEKVYMYFSENYGLTSIIVDAKMNGKPKFDFIKTGQVVLNSRMEKVVENVKGKDLKIQVDSINNDLNLIYFSGSFVNGSNISFYSNMKVEFLCVFRFYNENSYNLVIVERIGEKSENSKSNMIKVFKSITFDESLNDIQ